MSSSPSFRAFSRQEHRAAGREIVTLARKEACELKKQFPVRSDEFSLNGVGIAAYLARRSSGCGHQTAMAAAIRQLDDNAAATFRALMKGAYLAWRASS